MSRYRSDNQKSELPARENNGDHPPVKTIVVPKHLQLEGSYAAWRSETQMRLLSQLASDHFHHENTLTRKQLADLIELFSDEPLPTHLREFVTADLRETRHRKDGPKVQVVVLDQVELAMLPAVYDEAFKEAQEIRKQKRLETKKLARRTPVPNIKTARSLALEIVKKRLPSVAALSDRRLTNLITENRVTPKTSDTGRRSGGFGHKD